MTNQNLRRSLQWSLYMQYLPTREKMKVSESHLNMSWLSQCLFPSAVSSSLSLGDEDIMGHLSFDSGCSYLLLCLSWQMSAMFSVFLHSSPSQKCQIPLTGGVADRSSAFPVLHSHNVSFFMLYRPQAAAQDVVLLLL